MKTLNKYIIAIFLLVGFAACDFLDIVPDEKEKAEDAFEDVNAVERFMYSCYAYLPQSRSGSESLDFMTGDEVITAFEHETFAAFPKGNYTASKPVISYWNSLFQGLRQCYIMLNNIGLATSVDEEVKKDYIAQTNFLIAYYHFLLARCYGPIILIKEEPDILTFPKDYLGRTSYDDCVQFICDKFDEAARDLPVTRPVRYYGLATSVAAKALKAKMLLYTASPLFNGNSEFYADFKDKQGTTLMPLTYDPQKWVKAREAYKEAIQLAETNGYALYTKTDFNEGNVEPQDPTQNCLRNNIIDAGNSEIIWADSRNEGAYGLQNKSLPYCAASAWNGIAPTWNMLNRFYTKNGLPIDQDPNYNVADNFTIVTVDDAHKNQAAVGERTFMFNLDREPRYYAWVAFQGGFYEIMSAGSNGAYTNDASYKKYSKDGQGKLVCDFVLGGNCSRGSAGNMRQNNYSPTGFLNKKGVHTGYGVSKNLQSPLFYPWPIIRMAELYLGYAEACVETNDLNTAITYIDKVRSRAGIPGVKESWETIAHQTLTQDLLRKIVRQERQVEFYLENQNFWDLRRWKIAGEFFNQKAKGLNITATTLDEFVTLKEVIFERKFETPTQYLMPIPLDDVNRNENITQNPGY